MLKTIKSTYLKKRVATLESKHRVTVIGLIETLVQNLVTAWAKNYYMFQSNKRLKHYFTLF